MRRWLLKLLGPLLLVGLVMSTDLEQITEVLYQSDPLCFLEALACWLLIAALKGWRWQQILAGQAILIP